MAGDWIKVEKATVHKPEVLAMAERLSIHPAHALGLCVRFWCWCDDQLADGNARSVTKVTLDYVIGHDGASDALLEIGWLSDEGGQISVPNFARHLSQGAKNRTLTRDRVRRAKAAKGNAASVSKVTHDALTEKRREENSNKTLGNPVAGATASVKKQSLPDEEWLTAIESDPAYAGIEVRREFAKMSRWCAENRKVSTRRRFVNWLNRADKPISGVAASSPAMRKPASVWELTKAAEAIDKEISTLTSNPANKHAPDPSAPWETRLKPEVKSKIAELRTRAAELRQRIALAGQEAA